MKMGRALWGGLIIVLLLALAACGGRNGNEAQDPAAGGEKTETAKPSAQNDTKPEAEATNDKNSETAAQNDTKTDSSPEKDAQSGEPAGQRTIRYLDQEYTVPATSERVVITGSMESMEDALVLGIKPVGGITVGGTFPAMFAPVTGTTESIGEKSQPSVETIVKLKPDVIVSTTKFPAEVAEKLAKITTAIPVSNLSTDWEANLRLLAELGGKQDEAERVLKQYKDDLAAAKTQLAEKLKDKKVVAVRVRTGNIMLYRDDIFFNPSLYADLGLTAPEEVKNAKTQEVIALEKFSEMNPDIIFVQFAENENKDNPKALEELQANPIWKSIDAVKNGQVFVNIVDPQAQGGTAWSKISFLKAVVEQLSGA